MVAVVFDSALSLSVTVSGVSAAPSHQRERDLGCAPSPSWIFLNRQCTNRWWRRLISSNLFRASTALTMSHFTFLPRESADVSADCRSGRHEVGFHVQGLGLHYSWWVRGQSLCSVSSQSHHCFLGSQICLCPHTLCQRQYISFLERLVVLPSEIAQSTPRFFLLSLSASSTRSGSGAYALSPSVRK